MFNMFVVMITLAPCMSFCYFYLLIQNGNVYTAAELPCKQIAQAEEGLPYLTYIFVTYFVISCIDFQCPIIQ